MCAQRPLATAGSRCDGKSRWGECLLLGKEGGGAGGQGGGSSALFSPTAPSECWSWRESSPGRSAPPWSSRLRSASCRPS